LSEGEQTILQDWYNSLDSKGTLNWNFTDDLCKEDEIICNSDIIIRVEKL